MTSVRFSKNASKKKKKISKNIMMMWVYINNNYVCTGRADWPSFICILIRVPNTTNGNNKKIVISRFRFPGRGARKSGGGNGGGNGGGDRITGASKILSFFWAWKCCWRGNTIIIIYPRTFPDRNLRGVAIICIFF